MVYIRRRTDYLALSASPHRFFGRHMIVQFLPHALEACSPLPCVCVGITASRKIGNAVARNRAKRRIRAAATQVLMEKGETVSFSITIIAKKSLPVAYFSDIILDIRRALSRFLSSHVSPERSPQC